VHPTNWNRHFASTLHLFSRLCGAIVWHGMMGMAIAVLTTTCQAASLPTDVASTPGLPRALRDLACQKGFRVMQPYERSSQSARFGLPIL
jgi:hypothetical protein